MRRGIIAIGMAGLLAFTVTATPVPAADLGMPLKAPPITEPVTEPADYTGVVVAVLVATAIGAVHSVVQPTVMQQPPLLATRAGDNSSSEVGSPPDVFPLAINEPSRRSAVGRSGYIS